MLYLRQRGIEPQSNLIIGLPGDDARSVDLILELMKGLEGVSCTFNFLNVFPGTPLWNRTQELGIVSSSDDYDERYSVTAPTLSTNTMSADQQIAAYLRLQWSLNGSEMSRKSISPAADQASDH